MKFHEWEIPPGVGLPSISSHVRPLITHFQTPVGMTSVHIHQNPDIFPEPMKFKPERWLEKRPQGAPPLDRYLVSFSKGSRQCAGMKSVPVIHQMALEVEADSRTVWRRRSCILRLRRCLDGMIIRSCSRRRGWTLILNMICSCRSRIIGVRG
jgi:hypothetical protein